MPLALGQVASWSLIMAAARRAFYRQGVVRYCRCSKRESKILNDSDICTGLDVVWLIALGADSVLLGRAFIYALTGLLP